MNAAELGRVLQQQGREMDALAQYRQAARVSSAPSSVHAMLAQLLFGHGAWDEGAAHLAKAMLRKDAPLAQQLALANRLMAEGAQEAAFARAADIAARHPDCAAAHDLLGMMLTLRGAFEQAADSYQTAWRLDPRMARAGRALAALRPMARGGEAAARLQGLAEDSTLAAPERAAAHYALGKICEDEGDHAAAWTHFRQANRFQRALLVAEGRALDPRRHEQAIDRLIGLFTPEFFRQHADWGSASERPLLIVGMIRSGTTLVEQILSAHPAIAAGGELKFWSRRGLLHGLLAQNALEREAATQTASAYESLLRNIAPDAMRVTDKMPTNFLLLGLVHLLFPKARIVHCVRDPRDTCVSIFATPYGNRPDFAHDWQTILAYYRQYRRLMRHWQAVLPVGTLFEVPYEELVMRREPVTRGLIEFCGLAWDDKTLTPEANTRMVATPSNFQARQRVHDRSIGRWRGFAPFQEGLENLSL